ALHGGRVRFRIRRKIYPGDLFPVEIHRRAVPHAQRQEERPLARELPPGFKTVPEPCGGRLFVLPPVQTRAETPPAESQGRLARRPGGIIEFRLLPVFRRLSSCMVAPLRFTCARNKDLCRRRKDECCQEEKDFYDHAPVRLPNANSRTSV